MNFSYVKLLMRKFVQYVILFVCIAVVGAIFERVLGPREMVQYFSVEDIAKLRIANDNTQLVVVSVDAAQQGILSFYELQNEQWVHVLSTKAYIGRNGLYREREGDAKTPCGVFYFTKAFGIEPDPGCQLNYIQVYDRHYWNSDSKSTNYNRIEIVERQQTPQFSVKDSEHLIDYKPMYDYCLNISYNEEGTPYKGSAIFLHCMGIKPYTGGCVAIKKEVMRKILQRVNKNCKIIIDTQEKIARY